MVRGGWGFYNDDFTADIFSPLYGGPFSLTESFVNTITNNTPALTFQRPFLGAGTTGNVDVTGLDLDLRNAYAQQWNLTIERELGALDGHTYLLHRVEIDQSGLRPKHKSARAKHHAVQPEPPPVSAVPEHRHARERRRPDLSRRSRRRSSGSGRAACRTWRHGRGQRISPTSTRPAASKAAQPSKTLSTAGGERADAQYTPRHRFISTVIWELPFGSGKPFLSDSGFANAVLGGWQLSGSFIAQTGEFLTPTFTGSDPSNTQIVGGIPDRIGDGNLPSDQRTIERWFDASAFVVPPANSGRFGNSGRGIIVGPDAR